MTDVTPPSPDKVNPIDASVTQREKTRERVARHRAAKKQAAAIEFVRTDASLFLHPDRLSQKAGAPKSQLRRMALKELVDNALDAAESATLTEVDPDTFIVEDDGPGLPASRVLKLFSVTRPMMSTKLIRRPTRGMVGNGLRVATGAAFASGGRMVVESMGVMQELNFDRQSGETIVAAKSSSPVKSGTRVKIVFGDALPRDKAATSWGDIAIRLAGKSADPMLTHPDWYSEAAFAEVIAAARGTAGELASVFGVDLGNTPAEFSGQGQPDASERYINEDQPVTDLTLEALRRRAPRPPKLIAIEETAFPGAYKGERFNARVGGAFVPAIVQVWAREIGKQRSGAEVTLIVNRSPTVADVELYPGPDARLHGCGVYRRAGKIPAGRYEIVLALTTPAISLISDGKTPDLTPFADGICSALEAATKRAHRPTSRGVSIIDAANEIMEAAYLKASANNTLPANARQVMYAARGYILKRTGTKTFNDKRFTGTLLPEFINNNPRTTADWDVVYDARGHFVEPHSGNSIPLGTLQVRAYLQREPTQSGGFIATASGLSQTRGPGDRYGAVLFVEKEGFEPLLRKAKIAERYDIAVMSTKGMSVVAARAMVDRISADGLKILVAHDLDVTGLSIFGTLGGDNFRYTFKAPPRVHRLGLTLAQAEDLALESEPQTVEGDHDTIDERLQRYGADRAEREFILGGERIELNAMPSDIFIAWLEGELRAHGVAKVIPPADALESFARRVLGLRHVKDRANELEQAARAHAAAADLPEDLSTRLAAEFQRDDAISWEVAVERALQHEQGAAI